MEDIIESEKFNKIKLPNDNLSIKNVLLCLILKVAFDLQNQASLFLKKYGSFKRNASFKCIKLSKPEMIEITISTIK